MLLVELFKRLILLVMLTFAFMIMSIMNGIIVRVAIKSSILVVFPALCLQGYFIDPERRQQHAIHVRGVYQTLGHTGAMSAYLDRNNRSKCPMICAMILALIIFYLMYMASWALWTAIAFGEVWSGTLNEQYFFFTNCSELLVFLFVRTRSSIKYLPKYITMINLIFLMYVNQHMYSAQKEALKLLIWFSLFLYVHFIRKFELTAIKKWNPFGTYTPSENNTRCGY